MTDEDDRDDHDPEPEGPEPGYHGPAADYAHDPGAHGWWMAS